MLPNVRDRQILQRLLSGEWKSIFRLDTQVGILQLKRLRELGWIEQRQQEEQSSQIRITSAGVTAFKTPKK